jgi:general secretion pathway protein N
MRFRLPLGRRLLVLCAFLFALVALFPLRLALDWLSLDERGFAARETKGSIWLGALTEAQLGSIELGDLQARLSTLPLLVGRARVELERTDEANPLEGSVTVSRHDFGIDDVTGRLDIGSAFAPLPIASLDMTAVSAHFTDGQCSSAEGLVSASTAGDIAGLSLPSGLSGNVRCDEGALLLPLVSQTGMEALNIRLFEDGRYEIELAVRPADDWMRDRLIASGFALTGNGYVLSAAGEF